MSAVFHVAIAIQDIVLDMWNELIDIKLARGEITLS